MTSLSVPVTVPVIFSKYFLIMLLPERGYVAKSNLICSTALPVVYLDVAPKNLSYSASYRERSLDRKNSNNSSKFIFMSVDGKMCPLFASMYPG